MNVAELAVKCLENEGVEIVFGIPGEENIDLMEAIGDSRLRFVLARHEQAAAFMADVFGRLTGRAGVCLATLGPGATNLVTGVADAFLDRSPLVAITAQESLSRIHRESHQFIDTQRLFAPITKWNARIECADTTAEAVRKAFKIAQAEKPGSTHLELPADVARAATRGRPLSWERTRRPSPDRLSLDRAAELIRRANRPLILAGNGVIRGGASDELTRFAEGLQIPVVHTLMCKGAISWDSPMSLFVLAHSSTDYHAAGFVDADLVICCGYDLVEYDPKDWNPSGRQRIVHIDFTSAEVSAEYVPEVEIVADIRETIQLLRERVQSPKDPGAVRARRTSLLAGLGRDGEGSPGRSDPRRIVRALRAALGPDDLLISDVGAHKMWIGRYFPAYRPNTVIVSNGLASMGIALPGGIAAKMVLPERRVVTVSGDGGFLMNVQELETARRERTPTVNIIFRDEGLGSIRIKQTARAGRTVGTEFGNPDYVQLAEAFGARGFRAAGPAEFEGILRAALSANELTVIDVPVDYSESPF
ncbi:MAG: acetolactate synthase large subunit [Thermoplasmata archaeon]